MFNFVRDFWSFFENPINRFRFTISPHEIPIVPTVGSAAGSHLFVPDGLSAQSDDDEAGLQPVRLRRIGHHLRRQVIQGISGSCDTAPLSALVAMGAYRAR